MKAQPTTTCLLACWLLVTVFSSTLLCAQVKTGVLTGRVVDATANRALLGTTIRVLGTKLGAIADHSGKFTVAHVPAGRYSLKVVCVGYETRMLADIIVTPGQTTLVDVILRESVSRADSVVVSAGYFPLQDATPVSAIEFTRGEIRRSPGAAGDIGRVLSLSSTNARIDDSRNDIAVRGGGPAENAFYVDNIPFKSINYFPKQGGTGGPVSFLSSDIVGSMSLYSGGYGPSWGGLSSAVDVQTRSMGAEDVTVQADVNMTGLRLSAEGPLGIGGMRSTWYASITRGYLDLLKSFLNQVGDPVWASAQQIVTLDVSDNSKVTIVGFSVFSDFTRNHEEALASGQSVNRERENQHTYGVNWRYVIDTSGYMNTSVSFGSILGSEVSQRPIDDLVTYNRNYLEQYVHLRNVTHQSLSTLFDIDYGVDLRREWNTARVLIPTDGYVDKECNWLSVSPFVGAVAHIGELVTATAGLRVDALLNNDASLQALFQPRGSLTYRVRDNVTLAVAGGLYSMPTPFAILQYSTDSMIVATKSFHTIGSIAWQPTDEVRVTLEAYSKQYSDMPLNSKIGYAFPLDEAAGETDVTPSQDLIYTGKARAYGIDATLQKKMSDDFYLVTGLSFQRSFFTGSDGIERHRMFDNRWVGTITAGWDLGAGWETGAQFTTTGGAAYQPADTHLPEYMTLNVRVDKRFNFTASSLVLYLSVLNATDRRNVRKIERVGSYNEIVTRYHLGILPVFGLEWKL